MKAEEFNGLVLKRQDVCRKTLIKKAEEYAPEGSSRFSNFEQAAAMMQTTPEAALWGMMAKHIISLQDLATGLKTFNEATMEEKITDTINYCHLLEGILTASGRVGV
jgi:hypothetical protein